MARTDPMRYCMSGALPPGTSPSSAASGGRGGGGGRSGGGGGGGGGGQGRRSRHRAHSDLTARGSSRIPLVLTDLDYVRRSVTLAARPHAHVRDLDAKLRQYFAAADGKQAIPDGAAIRFYDHLDPLEPDDEVHGNEAVHYRVFPDGETNEVNDGNAGLRICYTEAVADLGGSAELAERLARRVDEGATVGEVRSLVAADLGVDDANTVVLLARGGLHPGPLPGNQWRARAAADWLCAKLTVDLCPGRAYLVLEGLGREYVYHPWSSRKQPAVEAREARSWLARRVLRDADRGCRSRLRVRSDDVALHRASDDRQLRGSARLAWGGRVRFAVAAGVEAAFSAEEDWLLRADRDCAVCGEAKKASEMPPRRVTARCAHEPATCRDCLAHWVAASLETQAWDALRCADCPARLAYDDVRRAAGPDVFARYDELAARAALKAMPDFHWCLARGCGAGQAVRPGCPRFKCAACGRKHCVRHGVRWHSGETCEQFDRRNKARRRAERASEAKVREIAKECPECRKPVHKYRGCNHITCICGHEWCYICFAAWRRDPATGILRCKHKGGCSEHDPFLEELLDHQATHQGQPGGGPADVVHPLFGGVMNDGHFVIPPPPPPPPQPPRFYTGPRARPHPPPPPPQHPPPPNFRRNVGLGMAAAAGIAALAGAAALRRLETRDNRIPVPVR